MKRSRILLVSDDGDVRNLLLASFRNGYRVTAVNAGEEAIASLKTVVPDLVVLCAPLPGIGGIETLRVIKNISPAIPVIMLSAGAEIGDAVRACRLGISDYFSRPFDINRMRESVRHAIGDAREPGLRGGEFPVDLEPFIADAVEEVAGTGVGLKRALRRFNEKYVDMVSSKSLGRPH